MGTGSAELRRIQSDATTLLEADGPVAVALAGALFANAHAEDVAGIDASSIAALTRLAHAALAEHRRGKSVIHVTNDADVTHDGVAVTVATVVNDNMPFLFDSVVGEINETARDVRLVVHPVLDVARTESGFTLPDSATVEAAQEPTQRTSVIQVVMGRLDGASAERMRVGLDATMRQVRAAVRDWPAMLGRVAELIGVYAAGQTPLKKEDVREAMAFLEWLRDDNFTFLGIREYEYHETEGAGELRRIANPGLGILSDPDIRILRRRPETQETTPEIRAFLNSREPLIVTKANTKSVVHRRGYMDYVGVKRFTDDGRVAGEVRILGLFTSTAYTRSVKTIPYLRAKAATVLSRSGYDLESHSGKALLNILESYPRDELFQVDIPTLQRTADAILALNERPRVRILSRVDPFDRFVSVLAYVPRDRYDSEVRQRIAARLANAYDAHLSAFYPAFPEGSLARVHFIFGRSGGKTPHVAEADLEGDVRAIIRTWDDEWADAVRDAGADGSDLAGLASAFPSSYREVFGAAQAARDARRLLLLSDAAPFAVDFYSDMQSTGLRIYHRGSAVPLSRRVPMLENMGFRVISEQTFELVAPDGTAVFLHDMELAGAVGPIDLSDQGALLEETLHAVWSGQSDDDAYNKLVTAAKLSPRAVQVLRAYGRYLRQAGVPYGLGYMAETLVRYPAIANKLQESFRVRHDPALSFSEDAASTVSREIGELLTEVSSLDDDRILRRYANAIEATLRTNVWRPADDGTIRHTLAFKFDPALLTDLPDPRPYREIFVFGPDVEGVHLRFGPVARGGLRWSDRPEDYRTEVLGLVKAQQVKNAVIVPVGAKGGFFPRRLPPAGDARLAAGREAYVMFVSALLSVTDNIVDGAIVPPPHVVRHDGDDPYLVVAADKGTATFSDIANGISQAHGFWLDDAFASGGSAGYDHKKMGITARGAWEAVKRHFREIGTDIQSTPFTVAGVGDMSGDVFGNGMLLSRQIRLVAAFDHRDIFIDPDPVPETSFAERERLFSLPRSSWQDYDRSVLSTGGGVFSRSAKAVTLSAEAAAAIGIDKRVATPFEIMSAILRAPVDLLWFGGIGTYVRASTESDAQAGDRANDPIRVAASELRAKVIGEGANLGVTQRGRIEYGLNGGRCNSDAIDNSAGVNSSDVEVNIKIALAQALRSGSLDRDDRNILLASMTDEVARLVLRNNYLQPLAISLAERRGMPSLALQARLMASLEARGALNRSVELLPTDRQIAERGASGRGLTRAEIGVLLSYAKLVLFDDLTASALPDDPYFEGTLVSYFPTAMQDRFGSEIRGHRLRREIVSTALANDAVNRGGPSVISRFADLAGALPEATVRAHVIVRDGLGMNALDDAIDALDTVIPGEAQNVLYQAVVDARHAAIASVLKLDASLPVGEAVRALRLAREALRPLPDSVLPDYLRETAAAQQSTFVELGAPDALARDLARLHVSVLVPDMMRICGQTGVPTADVAPTFLRVTGAFELGRISASARKIAAPDYYDGLAIARALDLMAEARRRITVAALTRHGDVAVPFDAWAEAGAAQIARVRSQIGALVNTGDLTLARLSVAAGLLNDLAN